MTAAIAGAGPGSPWLYLEEHWPDVRVFLRTLNNEHWGRTVWTAAGPVIYMRALLGPVAERCTLWHEIAHLELGPPAVPECPVNEQQAVEWTARRLLPDPRQLARILAADDVVAAAKRLRVTRRVLYDRLRGLDANERAIFETVISRAQVAG